MFVEKRPLSWAPEQEEDEAQQNGNAVNITKQEYDTFETPYIKLQIQEETLEDSDFKAVMCARHHLMHKMKHTPPKYASYLKYRIHITGYEKNIEAERYHANYRMKLQSHRRPSRRDRQHVPALVQNISRSHGYGFDAKGAPREPKTRRHRQAGAQAPAPEPDAAQVKADEGQKKKYDPNKAVMITRRHRQEPEKDAAKAAAAAAEAKAKAEAEAEAEAEAGAEAKKTKEEGQ